MLKRYYSIEEAAEFLTKESGQKINRMDVMILSMVGDIRLCAWVDERLISYMIDDHPKHPSADFDDSYHFKGYIQIPEKVITPSGGEVTYSPKHSVEIITYDGPPIAEVSHPYGFSCITSNCDSAVIPAEDLLKFISKNKESERLRAEKKLSTKERNTLLTIIGLMAQDGYRDDQTKPYALARKIQTVADKLGIEINDDTIARKLIAAKQILNEISS